MALFLVALAALSTAGRMPVKLNACVSDYTATPGPIFYGGLQEAQAVLRKAGVELSWTHCGRELTEG